MSDQANTTAALTACFDSLDELADGLSGDDHAVQSLCPDWDVAGVYLHLASIEHMLTGWVPESVEAGLPFEVAGAYAASLADAEGPAVVADYQRVIAARREELAAIDAATWALPAATPVGPGTYGRFMDIRVFDFWVHEQDMRRPLGRPGHTGGVAAELAIDEIEGSLGYIVGKKIGLADGQSIAFHLTGPVERDLFVAVDGRAGQVESLSDPTVALTADSTTFALLACGRIDPQGAIDDGSISWTGDPSIGDHAARSLRFTM